MEIQWVALDWGTTNLSAYAIGADGTLVDQLHNSMGMSQLIPSEFEPTLLDVIDRWLRADRVTPVLACGMVGAKEGWRDAGHSCSCWDAWLIQCPSCSLQSRSSCPH